MKGMLFLPWKIQFIAEHPDIELQTRRLGGLKRINREPDTWELAGVNSAGEFIFGNKETREVEIIKPRYQVGEVVYVKERALYWVKPILEGVEYDKPSDWWSDCVYQDDPEIPALLADNGRFALERSINQIVEGSSIIGKWEWKSAMFMPEHYARYFRKVVAVRAERVQEITPADCQAEGIDVFGGWKLSRQKFKELWNSINKDYPWGMNPFVFPYTFRLKEQQ